MYLLVMWYRCKVRIQRLFSTSYTRSVTLNSRSLKVSTLKYKTVKYFGISPWSRTPLSDTEVLTPLSDTEVKVTVLDYATILEKSFPKNQVSLKLMPGCIKILLALKLEIDSIFYALTESTVCNDYVSGLRWTWSNCTCWCGIFIAARMSRVTNSFGANRYNSISHKILCAI